MKELRFMNEYFSHVLSLIQCSDLPGEVKNMFMCGAAQAVNDYESNTIPCHEAMKRLAMIEKLFTK